jgi:hypothetical protein
MIPASLDALFSQPCRAGSAPARCLEPGSRPPGGRGFAAEVWRFGLTADASAARLERDVRDRFSRRAADVRSLAERVAADTAPAVAAAQDPDNLPALFDRLAALAPTSGSNANPTAVTVYVRQPPSGQFKILAWSDGPTELVGPDRLSGNQALFAAPGTMGLRSSTSSPSSRTARGATAAAEAVPRLAGSASLRHLPDGHDVWSVTLRFPGATEGARLPGGFACPRRTAGHRRRGHRQTWRARSHSGGR